MKNKLKEYSPTNNLKKYIASYWSFRNNTEKIINFPVVPDGCSDIIFYLNNSCKLVNLENTFISGVMEFAALIPTPINMELFGIRFNPGVLSYLLKNDMSEIRNKMCELSIINKTIYEMLKIDKHGNDEDIVLSINSILNELLLEDIITDKFMIVMKKLCENPELSINELSLESDLTLKSLERLFNKRIGLSPKKVARIIRFQKAHKKISSEGLIDLVTVALSAGYFDQAHFNREYKKLVGFNPNNETMSILYNT